jgi:DNA-binding XRE family transcriptional regulator
VLRVYREYGTSAPVNCVAHDQGLTMVKPKSRRSPGEADDFIGRQIRERRVLLGLTQQQFADMIGVTYQQAHKYEYGKIASQRAGCTRSRAC